MPPPLPPSVVNMAALSQLAIGTPTTPALAFDFILVLDFEATCEEPEPYNYGPEIIEFPVVVLNVVERRVVAEFHSFVRPVHNPVLSHFCTKLTGIRQSDVDNAPTLDHVVDRFQRWFQRTIPRGSRVMFATDGPWDMRDFMYQHAVCRYGVSFPSIFYTWIDVKTAFADFFNCRWSKIEAMLNMLGLQFEGRLHSGIDDARNITRIIIALLAKGCTFSTAIQRIPFPPDAIVPVGAAATGSPATLANSSVTSQNGLFNGSGTNYPAYNAFPSTPVQNAKDSRASNGPASVDKEDGKAFSS